MRVVCRSCEGGWFFAASPFLEHRRMGSFLPFACFPGSQGSGEVRHRHRHRHHEPLCSRQALAKPSRRLGVPSLRYARISWLQEWHRQIMGSWKWCLGSVYKAASVGDTPHWKLGLPSSLWDQLQKFTGHLRLHPRELTNHPNLPGIPYTYLDILQPLNCRPWTRSLSALSSDLYVLFPSHGPLRSRG